MEENESAIAFRAVATMRYACAILYNAQLVDAADADYDSYKNLGLLCPHCKQPVFLQAVSQRRVGDTLVEIPPHFKHFKAKDPALLKQCEARVAKYGAREIQRRAAQARNQRLRSLQRRFWSIFTRYYESINIPFANIMEKDGHGFVIQMSHTLSKKFLADKPDAFKATMLQIIEAAFTMWHREITITWNYDNSYIGVSSSSARQYKFTNALSGKLDRQMQELIACEVVDFLHSNSARPIVEKLFTLACCVILKAMEEGAQLGLIGGDHPELVVRSKEGKGINTLSWSIPENRELFYQYASRHIGLWLAMLPWASQMNSDQPLGAINQPGL